MRLALDETRLLLEPNDSSAILSLTRIRTRPRSLEP